MLIPFGAMLGFWFCLARFFLHFPLVCFEGDLKDPVAQGVAVKGLYGHQSLIVVGHGDEAEALTLVSL